MANSPLKKSLHNYTSGNANIQTIPSLPTSISLIRC